MQYSSLSCFAVYLFCFTGKRVSHIPFTSSFDSASRRNSGEGSSGSSSEREDGIGEIEVMSGSGDEIDEVGSPSSPTAIPPHPRSTMIAKHVKHSLLPHQSSPTPTADTNPNKEIELLVYLDNVDSIPYELMGTADSYDALRARLEQTIPTFAFNEPHELGVYSEYWEKRAGVPYVKPPRNWSDFPSCTCVLLRKTPEMIIIPNTFEYNV